MAVPFHSSEQTRLDDFVADTLDGDVTVCGKRYICAGDSETGHIWKHLEETDVTPQVGCRPDILLAAAQVNQCRIPSETTPEACKRSEPCLQKAGDEGDVLCIYRDGPGMWMGMKLPNTLPADRTCTDMPTVSTHEDGGVELWDGLKMRKLIKRKDGGGDGPEADQTPPTAVQAVDSVQTMESVDAVDAVSDAVSDAVNTVDSAVVEGNSMGISLPNEEKNTFKQEALASTTSTSLKECGWFSEARTFLSCNTDADCPDAAFEGWFESTYDAVNSQKKPMSLKDFMLKADDVSLIPVDVSIPELASYSTKIQRRNLFEEAKKLYMSDNHFQNLVREMLDTAQYASAPVPKGRCGTTGTCGRSFARPSYKVYTGKEDVTFFMGTDSEAGEKILDYVTAGGTKGSVPVLDCVTNGDACDAATDINTNNPQLTSSYTMKASAETHSGHYRLNLGGQEHVFKNAIYAKTIELCAVDLCTSNRTSCPAPYCSKNAEGRCEPVEANVSQARLLR